MSAADGVYVTALAGLAGMGPAGLRSVLAEASPAEAWAEVAAGRRCRPPSTGGRPVPAWTLEAAAVDLGEVADRLGRGGIGVTWAGRPDWPTALADDPAPPGALFWRGDLAALERTCVAVVGTRRATPEGRRIATRLGRDLADAGLCVVSGLALGIDGAAHRGALDARGPIGARGPVGFSGAIEAREAAGRTVGVAASGVDRPYPARHQALWEDVVGAGAVVSENPPGRPAQGWRFPARNRIIAGLSRLVVVVESHASGGSLLTADAAIERGIEVRAVPGPVTSPASAGTNQLLWDGPGPVRDATDVLDVLGSFQPRVAPAPRRRRPGPPPAPVLLLGDSRTTGTDAHLDCEGHAVLESVGYRPTSLNSVVAGCGLPVAVVSARLDWLVAAGLVVESPGWWQRC